MELLLIALVLVILAAFAVTANELGVDSRDYSDDTPTKFPLGTA